MNIPDKYLYVYMYFQFTKFWCIFRINDRVISVNGISLENVPHSRAIQVLKDSGNTVILVIRRRIVLPTSTAMDSNTPLKLTLSKKSRKDGELQSFYFMICAIFTLLQCICISIYLIDSWLKFVKIS